MKETAQFVDRRGTDCLKWDLLEKIYGQKDMLGMWVADMDFRSPECVQQAIVEQTRVGAYGYAAFHSRFMRAFAQWEKEQHGYSVETDWLRYSPGVVPAVNFCIQSMTQPGDRIMTLPPVYYPFFSAITDNGRELVTSSLVWNGASYEMNFADMEEKILSEGVKMLIFCSPHNPVGRVWRREELERLAQLCRRHHVTIVSDEIHHDFVFAPAKHIPLATIAEDVVTLTAPSKTFNLAGLSTAVAIIPDEEKRKQWDTLTKHLHLTSGNTIGYAAGEAAYLHGLPWLEDAKQTIYGNYCYLRQRLLTALPELVIPPLEGTYLMWVDFGAYLKPEEQKEFFTCKCKLALDYGQWFRGGGETFVRFNLATSREIVEKAADAVITAMNAHRDIL